MTDRRNPPLKFTLPDVIDPPDRLCFTIEVPNNLYHIGAFRGALNKLASAIFWQDDPLHKAKDVAQVWRKLVDNVRVCEDCDTNTGILLEDLMSQQIRISPDDPCVIQQWCVDHWEDWYDPRPCVAGTIEQPTDGSGIEPGECREWDVSLRGNEKWLLPASVNEGDTIEITDASGAWNDGGIGWNCVNGFTYALGACVSAEAAQPGDPLQSANHMRLIENIDGVWWDAFNTLQVVLGSVTDGEVYFQANDGNLSDNSGSVSFHVKYCKADINRSITYDSGSGPNSWVNGQLFTMTAEAQNDGGNTIYVIDFYPDPCATLTIESLSGWSLYNPAPTATVYADQPCGGSLNNHTTGGGTTSIPMPFNGCIERMYMVSSTPFSAGVRLTDC